MDKDSLKEPNVTRLNEWKELAQKGEAPEDTCVYKAYDSEVKLGKDGDRSVEFIISTGSVDRDGDIVVPSGGSWDAYLRNGPGPVLFAHDYRSIPIARCSSVVSDESTVRASAEFPTKEDLGIPDGHPSMSETIFRMLKGRLGLKNASIGFNPEEWTFDEKRMGYNFVKWEGLEWSIIPVPANRDAVSQASAKGIDLSPIWYWATKALDTNPDLVIVEKKSLEEIRSQAKEKIVFVDLGSIQESIKSLEKRVDSIEDTEKNFGDEKDCVTKEPELTDDQLHEIVLEGMKEVFQERSDAQTISRSGRLPY